MSGRLHKAFLEAGATQGAATLADLYISSLVVELNDLKLVVADLQEELQAIKEQLTAAEYEGSKNEQ